MKLTNLAYQGVKNRNGNHQLNDVNIVVGRNFTGKTAVLDALTVGLLGYSPRLGKQPAATLKLAGNGQLSVNITTSAGPIQRNFYKSTKKKNEEIVPEGWDFPSVMISAKEYLGMTGPQRIKYVFDRVSIEDDRSTLVSRLKSIPTSGEDQLNALTQFVNDMPDSESIQELVETVLESAKETKRTMDSTVKSLTGFNDASTQMTTDAGVLNADVESQLKQARDKAMELNRQLSKYQAEQEQNVQRLGRMSTIKDRLQLAAESDVQKLIQQKSEAEEQLQHMNDDVPMFRERFSALDLNCDSLTKQKAQAEADLNRAKKRIGSLGEVSCCPKCGHVLEEWKDKEKASLKDEIGRLEERTHELDGLLHKALTERNLVKADLDGAYKAQRQIQTLKETVSALDAEIRKQQATVDEASNLARELKETKEVFRHPDEFDEQIDRIENEMRELDQEIRELEQRQKQVIAARQDALRSEEARQRKEKVEAGLEIIKAVIKSLEDYRKELVEKAFGQLLGVARRFTTGILPSDLEFRNGDLGWTVNGAWISHETFSGTEELIALAGLSVALCQSAPSKIVMMDELGRLSSDNKKLLVQRMNELVVDGVIDQFIGVDTDTEDYIGQPVNLIEV